MSRSLYLSLALVVALVWSAACAADPSIAIAVTANGQPVIGGQTVSGVVNITVTVTNGVAMHTATYGNMIFLPFNEAGHAPDTPVWSHTTQVDTKRFYDGENLLSVHVHPHNHAGEPYEADFTFATFKLVTANANPAPNGDLLLPTVIFPWYSDWTPQLSLNGYELNGAAELQDDTTPSTVDRSQTQAAPIQMIAHLGDSVLGRFRWNTLTPPFGDSDLVSQCSMRPFQRDQEFDARVVLFFTDGVGRANYATKTFRMPALLAEQVAMLPQPLLDAKIVGLADGGTLRVPDSGTAPLYVQLSNLTPGAYVFPEMTIWIGNRAVSVTKLLPLLRDLPESATSMIIEVPIPADEVAKMQVARQGGEMSTAMPIWVDFNQNQVPCLPTSSHIHLNSVRTTSYPWPYGQATVVIRKPWNGSAHWTGSALEARYDFWGPLPSGYHIRWSLDGGAWVVENGDGVIPLTGLNRQSHRLDLELVDAANVRLPGTGSFATSTFTVVNAAPTSTADVYAVTAGATLTVSAAGLLANDQDPDGDLVTAVLENQPLHGTLTLAANGSFSYTPVLGYLGFDHFTYRANDGSLKSPTTDVRVQITPAAAGAQLVGDWPMLGRDAQHTGYFPGIVGKMAPSLAWTTVFPDGANTVNSPSGTAVVGGRVVTSIDYYAYSQVRVACLDAATGGKTWERLSNAGDVTGPAIGNGMAYVGRSEFNVANQMEALDLTTGALRWSAPYATQNTVDWAPTVADGGLWSCAPANGGLYGYDAQTGAQRFQATLPDWLAWSPAYLQGKVYTWLQGKVRLHDALTGAVLAQNQVMPIESSNGWMNTMPVLADNRVLMRGGDRLIACNSTDLSLQWQILLPWEGTMTPVVRDGVIYAPEKAAQYAMDGGWLTALDLATGRILGRAVLPDPPRWGPIVTDDALIVSCLSETQVSPGATYIIDRATLAIRQVIPFGGHLALANNALYITDAEGNRPAPSVRKFAFTVMTSNTAPVAVSDAVTTAEDTALSITAAALLANDSDADGNALTVRIVTQPTRGTLTTVSGGFLYQPAVDAFGTDTFTYVAGDGLLESQPATVTINVTPVEDPQVSYKPGLLAEFFDYTTALTAIPNLAGRTPDVIRTDAQIAYASVTTAWAGLPSTMIDTFASRHSGWLKVDTAGSYTLFVSSDDGSRVFLDGALVINNDGVHLMQERSATRTLTVGYHRLQVEFFEGTSGAGLEFRWSGPGISKQLVSASALWQAGDPPLYQSGLRAEFFDYTTSLSVIPDLSTRTPDVVRTDAQIAYASVGTAWAGLPASMADTFASRHTGWLKVDTAGAYTLFVSSDDGSRVYLNGALVINNDGLHGMQERSATLTLAPGFHQLRVEFFEGTGGAGLELRWSGPGIAKQVVPANALWQSPNGVVGVPPPWTAADVGSVGVVGSAQGNGTEFSVTGSGADIWGTADAFRFVYRPLTVNGELIARVASLQNTNAWAKAGVMVRASTAAGSVNAFMAITPGNGATFQSRTVTGGASTSVVSAGKTAPYWVRLVRNGTSVTGWISPDGVTWTQVGATVTLPLGATPVIGLGVTGHNNAVRSLSIFDQVLLIPYAGG